MANLTVVLSANSDGASLLNCVLGPQFNYIVNFLQFLSQKKKKLILYCKEQFKICTGTERIKHKKMRAQNWGKIIMITNENVVFSFRQPYMCKNQCFRIIWSPGRASQKINPNLIQIFLLNFDCSEEIVFCFTKIRYFFFCFKKPQSVSRINCRPKK